MAIVGGLLSSEPRDFGLGGSDQPGGIDRCGLSARQLVLEVATLGATAAGERGEHADACRARGGRCRRRVGGGESCSWRCELAAGVVELALAVGRLAVEDGLVGGDEFAEVGVEGPGVVDGGHGGVGDAGERDGDLIVGVGIVGETAAEVEGGKGGGVPGVGGLQGAGLGGVPAVGVEGGGAREVDVVPGASLGAVDGTCPGMRDVG